LGNRFGSFGAGRDFKLKALNGTNGKFQIRSAATGCGFVGVKLFFVKGGVLWVQFISLIKSIP